MNDTGFRQSLYIAADPAAVFEALTTVRGLRGWWTPDCDGESRLGGTLMFRFARTSKAMNVEALKQDREVRWLCTEANIVADSVGRSDERVGTRLVFRLTPEADGTRLDFEHAGLTVELQCYELCCRGWRHFMGSLKQYVETGRGQPYERHVQVPTAGCAPATAEVHA